VEQLHRLAAATKPGTKVNIEVIRDGAPVTVRVRVSQRDSEVAMGSEKSTANELGLDVVNPTSQEARSLGVESDMRGVVVAQVDPNGLAYMAGIRPGDVILDVQGEPVGDVAAFQRQLQEHDLKSGVRLAVQSGDMRRFVLLQSKAD